MSRLGMWFLPIAVLLASSLGNGPSEPPDLSGRWISMPGLSEPEGLPAGPPLTIVQDRASFTVSWGTQERNTYRLNGMETKREKKSDGRLIVITSKANWVGNKLVITEQQPLSKVELTYFLGPAGQLVTTSITVLLHTSGGKLSVSEIGPVVRVYRKD